MPRSTPRPAPSSRASPAPAPTTPTRAPNRATTLSPSNSPAKKVPTVDPTIYHTRIRSILSEFKRSKKAWDDLVLGKGLRLLKEMTEIRQEMDATIRNATFAQGTTAEKVVLRDGYTYRQTLVLRKLSADLDVVLHLMDEKRQRLSQLADDAEVLVGQASRSHGIAFAFQTPLWNTWPPYRFAENLDRLSAPYLAALDFHRTLALVIKSEEEAVEGEKQAATSYWACQPLIPDEGEGDSEWGEEIWKVEVEGW